MDYTFYQPLIEKIVIERNKKVDSEILGEIQRIAVENGIETKIILNEKNVVDAIKKQMPQKVNISLKGTTDFNTKCNCPICRKIVFDGQKYCSNCGQKLDWVN